MWFDELPSGSSWTVLWRDLIICPECEAIRPVDALCPICRNALPPFKEIDVELPDGRRQIPQMVFMGAEGRYEDYVYLRMIEREWKRPIVDTDYFLELPESERPSPRASVVPLFWTYFETRMERLLRRGMRDVPSNLMEDTLRRYSFVGARLERLYNIMFDSTYFADLKELGFAAVAEHLGEVQRRRNRFSHGNPKAIDDALVKSVVEGLKQEHEAWIAVFNRRTTKIQKKNNAA